MKKLLALHYRPPFKNGRSNSFGQYYFHQVFKEKYEVRGLAFGENNEHLDDFKIIPLQSSSIEKILKFIFGMKSVRLTHFESNNFSKAFYKEIEEFNPDIIYVEHVVMMQYLIGFKTKANVILFDDDSFLFSKKNKLEGSFYQRIRNYGLTEFEKKALKRADYVITITDEEKSYLESLGYKNVFCVPYDIDTDYFSFNWRKPKENSILFVGNFDHYPNREAVKYLTREVLPLLTSLNCKLRIVGRNIYRIKKYLSKEIEVFENVEDVREYYWNSTLFVVPIFSQSGLRIKVLEAAACGIPILLTRLANLGIGFNMNEAFVTDNISKETLTTNILEIVSNLNIITEEKLINMSQLARRKIEYKFSHEASQNRMENFIVNYLK